MHLKTNVQRFSQNHSFHTQMQSSVPARFIFAIWLQSLMWAFNMAVPAACQEMFFLSVKLSGARCTMTSQSEISKEALSPSHGADFNTSVLTRSGSARVMSSTLLFLNFPTLLSLVTMEKHLLDPIQ